MKLLAALALAAASLNAGATQFTAAAPRPLQYCAGEAIYGFPLGRKLDTTPLCRKAYVMEYDNAARLPIWGAYLITPKEVTGCGKRTNSFTPDISIRSSARANMKDYKKSGYDQGHMVNAADMLWDQDAEEESFLLSNMAPQLPEFNRGIWKKLEDSTRGWTLNRDHAMQVYVGPIYDRDKDSRIGANQITVPHGFWKVIIDTQTSDVMVFKFNHEGSKKNLDEFVSSLAEVQRLTGLVLPMPKNAKFADHTWPRIMKSIGRQKNVVCSLQLQ